LRSRVAPDDIDREDALRAGDRGALDHIQTYAAGSEDGHSAARADFGRVEDRPDAGHHRTADQRCFVERRIVR
jgi:hypothetical protein